MAKLIAFALAFTALVAFASAHNTIVTTTIEEENVCQSTYEQCGRQIMGKRFNQCEMYLQQGKSWYELDNRRQMQGGGLRSCCQELQNVEEQCQCAAVKEAFRQAQKMQQQQQGQRYSSQQVRQLKQKAQNLPNQCNLQTRQCQIGTIFLTTTTTIMEDNTRGSQQCQHIRGRRFNQCQTYIQQQISGSSGTLLMSINRQGGQPQGLEQCCNELQNVEEECQCEAMKEVYWQAQQIQQQGGRRGGEPQTQDLQKMVQNLRTQCKLQGQQCRIPSAMF